MLSEEVAKLHNDFESMRHAYEAITIAILGKEKIEDACEKLKRILDKGKLVSINEEIKTAIVSVYNIFELASKSLNDKSVADLFNHKKGEH